MQAKYNGGDPVLQIAVSELPVEGFSMIGNVTMYYGTIEKPLRQEWAEIICRCRESESAASVTAPGKVSSRYFQEML